MSERADILITGTGAFAARILFDLAATADTATRIAVAGRNAARLGWLATAARARAHMYGRPLLIATYQVDLGNTAALKSLLADVQPAAVLQAASLQAGSVIAGQKNAWADLVASGGLSASAVFQAVLSARVARCCAEAAPATHFVNACFPDVANTIIAAMGLPITCGIGNIQILAHAFAGALAGEAPHHLKLLAHYQNLAAWRRSASERAGPGARVWLDGTELTDVFDRFSDVLLTPEPVIDISGAAAAPLLLALAHGRDWHGHVPGPHGLPGGYPVAVGRDGLALDLPGGMSPQAAVAWNLAHEQESGLVVDGDGYARYTGKLRAGIASASPELASGFHVRDLEDVFIAMQQVRQRLTDQRT